MRSCALYVALLLLLAGTAYSVWQIHLLRGEVAKLERRLLLPSGEQGNSMAAHAQAAFEALQRGQLDRAREELEAVADLIEEAQATARIHYRRLGRHLARAQEAVASRSEEALALVRELVQDIAREEDREGDARQPDE